MKFSLILMFLGSVFLSTPFTNASGFITLRGKFKSFDGKFYYFKDSQMVDFKVARKPLERIAKPKLNNFLSITLPESIVIAQKVKKPKKMKKF